MFDSSPLHSRRNWQDKAASAEAKLKTLMAQLDEVRGRFRQAQREIETQEVRIIYT
jgi:hypothetical protein